MASTSCLSCRSTVPAGRFCAFCGGPLTPSPDDRSAVTQVLMLPSTTQVLMLPVILEPDVDPNPTLELPVVHLDEVEREEGGPPTVSPSQPAPAVATESVVSPRGDLSSRTSSRAVGVALMTAALIAGAAFVVLSGGERHTVTGDYSLTDNGSFAGLSNGNHCTPAGGFADITAGTPVILADQDGKALSTGHLGAGTYDGADCVVGFTFTDVPKARSYRVRQGGDRALPEYSYNDMVKNDWAIHLTLGD